MKAKNDLTADFVRSILDYDHETGVFRWKWRKGVSNSGNGPWAGKVAGGVNNTGYVAIKINGRQYLAHRLAWLIINGEWPTNQIDHIDINPVNNRIANLRLATSKENKQNSGLRKDSATGVTGVHWYKRDRKFMAHIRVDGNLRHLGYFPTLAEAAAAREAAEIKYFGDFRRAA
jgi:hypothetical protein